MAVCEELITVANAEAGAKEVNNGGYVKPRSGKQDRIENGGSYGVLKAIDDAISIMNRLREVESKKIESDIPSSYSSCQSRRYTLERDHDRTCNHHL